MQKALQAIIFLSLGVGIGWLLKTPPEPIKEVVELPASDEQLIAFWFGEGYKHSLRKRVCGK